MIYYTLAAATMALASASAPSDYEGYVSSDTTPVCMKHYESDRNRLCNLFLSCYPSVFNSGVTGDKHCPEACALMTQYFPKEVCKADNWNQRITHKFENDEDNMQFCYTQNDNVGRKCVDVDSFVDINGFEILTPPGCDVPNNPKCTNINQISYHYVNQAMSWDAANDYCQRNFENGSLATIHSEEEMEKFKAALPERDVWIGAHRASNNNSRWFWLYDDEDVPDTSGVEMCLNHPLWHKNGWTEPNSSGEKCAHVWTLRNRNGERSVNDSNCGNRREFMCSSRC